MFWHPIRAITDITGIRNCRDCTENNIIYFGNYVLFRPNYQRHKCTEQYRYFNAIIIDLDNSYVDINKFYSLLGEHNINITEQDHILHRCQNSSYDSTWIDLLKQVSVTKYLEIPETNNYKLHKLQFNNKTKTLLVTSRSFEHEDKHMFIDLTTMSIIPDEEITKQYIFSFLDNISITCGYTYFTDDYDYALDIIDGSNYHNVDFDSIICVSKYDGHEDVETNYTHFETNAIKSNGLMFVNEGFCNIEWHIENFGIYNILDMLNMDVADIIPPEILYNIYDYVLVDVYEYLKKTDNLMQKIYITAMYYLEGHPQTLTFDKLKMPTTYNEFKTLVIDTLGDMGADDNTKLLCPTA